MDDFHVVRTHSLLLEYVDQLQKANAHELAFYPKATLLRDADLGRLFLGLLNGEPCGYIYAGSDNSLDMRCFQVCIEYDARRRLYGAALVSVMEEYAESGNCLSISLRCGFDLEANEFWQSMGYQCVSTVTGGARRGRKINIWRKQLQSPLFLTEVEPAAGETDQGPWKRQWKKNRKTGVVTEVESGPKLEDYQTTLIEAESDSPFGS